VTRSGAASAPVTVEDGLARALELGEVGVQVAAYRHGELIVDSFAGTADSMTARPVNRDTLFPVFSVTKAITATALHVQAARGLVDYDAPIAVYWPEFARNGKDRITVHHVLTHRSGLPQMPADVTIPRMCDWDWMISSIEDLTPRFEPGTVSAYQSLVFGWLVAEVVRRTDPDHRPFGSFVRDEISRPLAIDDLWLGVPNEALPRVAVLYEAPRTSGANRSDLASLAMPSAVAPNAEHHNDAMVLRACLPGAGAVMTARAGARFFAMLANGGELDGVRILPEDHVRWLTTHRERSGERDLVLDGGLNACPAISVGGFRLSDTIAGDGSDVLCHPGSGGSIAWAELDRGLAVAICHNRMFDESTMDEHPFARLAQGVRST